MWEAMEAVANAMKIEIGNFYLRPRKSKNYKYGLVKLVLLCLVLVKL